MLSRPTSLAAAQTDLAKAFWTMRRFTSARFHPPGPNHPRRARYFRYLSFLALPRKLCLAPIPSSFALSSRKEERCHSINKPINPTFRNMCSPFAGSRVYRIGRLHWVIEAVPILPTNSSHAFAARLWTFFKLLAREDRETGGT